MPRTAPKHKTQSRKVTSQAPVFNFGVKPEKTLRRKLTQTSTLLNNTGLKITCDPTAAVQWTNLAAVYNEYRVLGFKVHFNNGLGGSTGGWFITGFDRANLLVTGSSAGSIFALENGQMLNADCSDRHCLAVQANSCDLQHQVFSPTSGSPTASSLYAQHIFNQSGATINYFIEFDVEFRALQA